jgi:hypothetical protein
MPTTQKLGSMPGVKLAVLCEKVANDPSAFANSVRDKASQLRNEWATLQVPTDPDYEKEKALRARRADVKIRIAEFLSSLDSAAAAPHAGEM